MIFSNERKQATTATDPCHYNNGGKLMHKQQSCVVGFVTALKICVLVSAGGLMLLQSLALVKALALLNEMGRGEEKDTPSAGFVEQQVQTILDKTTSISKESILLALSNNVETPLPSCCVFNASVVPNNKGGKKSSDPVEQINQCRKPIDKKWQYKAETRVATYDYEALVAATQCAAVENPSGPQRNLLSKSEPNQCFKPSPYFQEISRVPAPRDYQEMQEHTTRAIPVIFTGYNKDSIMWSWTLDSLHDKLGHHPMRVRHGEYESLESRKQTKMTVSEFIDIVRGRKKRPKGLPPYLGNNKINDELLREFAFEPIDHLYHDEEHRNVTSFWVGAAGTKTPLHKDSPDNFAYMVEGTKEWTIFPPEDLFTLGCFRCGRDVGVDFEKGGNKMNGLCWCPQGVIEDGACLPQGSQPYRFELRKGEVMYLPAGWLHSVRNLDETIMINRWMRVRDISPISVWDSQLPQFLSSAPKKKTK